MKYFNKTVYFLIFSFFISCNTKEQRMQKLTSTFNSFKDRITKYKVSDLKNIISIKNKAYEFPIEKTDLIFSHLYGHQNSRTKPIYILEDLKNLILKFIGQKKYYHFLTKDMKGNINTTLFYLDQEHKKLFLFDSINLKIKRREMLNSWLIRNDLLVYVSKSNKDFKRNFNFLNLKNKKKEIFQKKSFFYCNYIGNNQFAFIQEKHDPYFIIRNFKNEYSSKINIFNYIIDNNPKSLKITYIAPFYDDEILISVESKSRIYLLILDIIKYKEKLPIMLNPIKTIKKAYIESIKFCKIDNNKIAILHNYNDEKYSDDFFPINEIIIYDLKSIIEKELTIRNNGFEYINNIYHVDDKYIISETDKNVDYINIENGEKTNITDSAIYINDFI
ncbi:MAG: hypothetical protein GY830_05675 [Bacteroidetes bacterium]|nr:hypothetical protein [Bacteroidota bacterium]